MLPRTQGAREEENNPPLLITHIFSGRDPGWQLSSPQIVSESPFKVETRPLPVPHIHTHAHALNVKHNNALDKAHVCFL